MGKQRQPILCILLLVDYVAVSDALVYHKAKNLFPPLMPCSLEYICRSMSVTSTPRIFSWYWRCTGVLGTTCCPALPLLRRSTVTFGAQGLAAVESKVTNCLSCQLIPTMCLWSCIFNTRDQKAWPNHILMVCSIRVGNISLVPSLCSSNNHPSHVLTRSLLACCYWK